MFGAPDKAFRVATGEAQKGPWATISGEWNPLDEATAVKNAQQYLTHEDWRQVGYDPERHGYFYDRHTMEPVTGAEEVLQIGPLVLAKKPTYGVKAEQKFAGGGRTGFLGALAKTAEKGLERAAKAARVAPQDEALRLAQQRAALPPSQGGLGLPASNTPMQRAKAMGAEQVFHGTNKEKEILKNKKFDINKDERNVGGVWTTKDKNYADWLASQKEDGIPSVMELKLLKAKEAEEFDILKEGIRVADEIGAERPANAIEAQELLSGGYGWDSVVSDLLHESNTPNLRITNFHDNWHSNPDYVTEAFVSKDPDLLRLPEAAFDPFRKDAATAAAFGVAAPDLLAQEQEPEKELTIDEFLKRMKER
jgi:hypothetical protein